MANPAAIAELLMKTGHAHHEAFIATNGEDPEWASWYGNHMAEELSAELGVPVDPTDLGAALAELDQQQRAEAPTAEWPAYYAGELMMRYASA